MQIVEFGEGKIDSLGRILSDENPKKVLILRGQKSFDNFSEKIHSFVKSDYASFGVKESNISLDFVYEGVKFYNDNNCDLIISIGGGSVIDMGKLISIFSTNKLKAHDYINGKEKFKDKKNRLISIPTTSGSGSEATHFAVVYEGITKYSIAHKSLLPDYSIIDPELTYSLTSYQTAVSGMDALCQAIESFWSLNSTNESRKYSEKAIKLIIENLENAVIRPDNDNRHNMALGSHIAGRAINIAKTTAAHAFSYPLTQLFGIPHGHAVSLTIGKFYEYNFRKLSLSPNQDIMVKLNKILDVNDGLEAKKRLESIISKTGLSLTLPNNVIFEDVVSKVVENVNFDRLANNPVEIVEEDIINIFESLCS